jgi:hypothetical protein
VLDEELDKDDLERLFVVAGVQLVCGDGAARTSQSHARLAAIGELDARNLEEPRAASARSERCRQNS